MRICRKRKKKIQLLSLCAHCYIVIVGTFSQSEMFKTLIRCRTYAVVTAVLLVVSFLQTTSATEFEARVERKFLASETKQTDSVQGPWAQGKKSLPTTHSEGSGIHTVTKNASENQKNASRLQPDQKQPADQACPGGTSCSSTRKALNAKKSKSAKTPEDNRSPPRTKEIRQSLSDEEIAELLADPHVDTLAVKQQQHWNNSNNRLPWVFQSSSHLYNTRAIPSQNVPLYYPQFQSNSRLQEVSAATQQRTKVRVS